jgi:hypothetical protein
MRKLVLDILVVNMMLGVAVLGLASPSSAQYVITEIIGGGGLRGAEGVAVDSSGNVYVTGANSHNAFKIQPCERVPVLSNGGLAVLGASLLCVVFWVARRQRMANA